MEKGIGIMSDTLKKISIIKTLYINFKCLDLKTALKFPIYISRNVSKMKMNGSIIIDVPKDEVYRGMISIGFVNLELVDERREKGKIINKGKIIFRGSAIIGSGVKIINSGTIDFGDSFMMSGKSTLICKQRMIFGKKCLLSWDILMMDSDLHPIFNYNANDAINNDCAIICGDHVWIGSRSTILKGSKISKGSVIGSCSVITNELTEHNSIYVGNGKCIRHDIKWSME